MQKRRLYLLLIGIGVVGLLVVLNLRSREPEYGGKRLSEWVESYGLPARWSSSNAVVDNAIAHIGTNAVPYLLKWLSYEPTPWKAKFYVTMNAIAQSVKSSRRFTDNKDLQADRSMWALIRLGPDADGAVVGLTKLLNDPKAIEGRVRAASVFVDRGKAGLPPLLSILTNQESTAEMKSSVASAIGFLRTNGTSAIPVLQNLLMDPDLWVRNSAKDALRMIDRQGREKRKPTLEKTGNNPQ